MSETAFTDSTEPSDCADFDFGADLRRVHVHNVAQLFLGVKRDSHRAGVAFHPYPLVLFGVTEIFWIHGLFRSLVEW